MGITKSKICALIPFYNEEKFIEETVRKTANFVDLIVAVNDGSTDKSVELIKNQEKIIVVNHEKNLGKGAAIKTGFEKALKLNCDLLITLDADMQHNPDYIPQFIEKAKEENADLVIGNRRWNVSGMPPHRRLSNFLTSKLLTIKTGAKILDSQSGYRLFRCGKLPLLFPKFTGFEAESEILVKAARNNLKISFVNIPTIYNDNKSKMKSVQAIIGFIKVLFI